MIPGLILAHRLGMDGLREYRDRNRQRAETEWKTAEDSIRQAVKVGAKGMFQAAAAEIQALSQTEEIEGREPLTLPRTTAQYLADAENSEAQAAFHFAEAVRLSRQAAKFRASGWWSRFRAEK